MGKKMGKSETVTRLCEVILEHYDAHIPAKDRCQPLSVSGTWPGTDYAAVLQIEQDLTGPVENRRIRVMMHEKDSDKAVSFYMAKGEGAVVKAWLSAPENREELLQSYEKLKASVDDFD